MEVRILSGYTAGGGSTISFINLTNALNEVGIKTTFYGPHPWHTKFCNGRIHENKVIPLNPDDILIVHFLNIQKRLNCRKFIFSSHEQNYFELKKINCDIYDKIHYVSQHQYEYHGINHPFFIIPNIIDNLKPTNKENVKGIYGIIGSIDRNKQVHKSIERAIQDGAEKVLIYGRNTEPSYYNQYVLPLINRYQDIIILKGYEENKQKIYDSIEKVYQDSIQESWGYVARECYLTNTEFCGSTAVKDIDIKSKKEIVDMWRGNLRI